MRETLARLVCGLTLTLVLALALLFAARHNPRPDEGKPAIGPSAEARPQVGPDAAAASQKDPSPRPLPPPPDPELMTLGRRVYETQRCALCHSVAGEGNPRHPLDDVGSRLSPEALRQWITGTGLAEGALTPSVVRRKRAFATLPEEDLKALGAYLAGLRGKK